MGPTTASGARAAARSALPQEPEEGQSLSGALNVGAASVQALACYCSPANGLNLVITTETKNHFRILVGAGRPVFDLAQISDVLRVGCQLGVRGADKRERIQGVRLQLGRQLPVPDGDAAAAGGARAHHEQGRVGGRAAPGAGGCTHAAPLNNTLHLKTLENPLAHVQQFPFFHRWQSTGDRLTCMGLLQLRRTRHMAVGGTIAPVARGERQWVKSGGRLQRLERHHASCA